MGTEGVMAEEKLLRYGYYHHGGLNHFYREDLTESDSGPTSGVGVICWMKGLPPRQQLGSPYLDQEF